MTGPIDVRDRALLPLGFAGAFRRSEFVGLDIGNLDFNDDGLVIQLKKALKNWLAILKAESGPVFRSINRAPS